MPPPIRYEIIDGVRRAKVFSDSKIPFIPATTDGTTVFDVQVESLGSPHRDEIDASSSAAASLRYNRIIHAVRNGSAGKLPPILVRPGQRGPHISLVRVL
jgi:hypothetical protein